MSQFMSGDGMMRSTSVGIGVRGLWWVDVAGIWHKDRGDGILECRGAPVFGDGKESPHDNFAAEPPKDAWVCGDCKAEITRRIVEEL